MRQVFVTRDELRETIDKEWKKLFRVLDERRADRETEVIATTAAVVWACAKAWLPDHAAHVGRSIACIRALADVTSDERVAASLTDVADHLEALRPAGEDGPKAVQHVAH